MNPPANDGCNPPGSANECKFTPAPASEDLCPGQAIAIPAGTTIVPESSGMSTYGFKDDYLGSCAPVIAPPGGGLDRVFQLTAAQSGTMTVKIGYQADGVTPACNQTPQVGPDCWAAVVYARSTCGTASTELACGVGFDQATSTDVPTSISFPVVANTPYWVFVDGYDSSTSSYGPFNFIVTLQ